MLQNVAERLVDFIHSESAELCSLPTLFLDAFGIGSEMSEVETRGLFIRPQQVLYVDAVGVSKLVFFYPNFISFFLFVCTGSCIGFFSPLIAISYY